jgi:hypothetical protein
MINAWPELTPAIAGGFWVNIVLLSPLGFVGYGQVFRKIRDRDQVA